ncbi:unnamed protein product [Urochloa decumbens]|uniref:DUF1618 domain-containing protein n=1 Tax=Urochloa decumbens TaxID=240449 RepID=A0ABC9B9Z7_9POAL
MHESVILPILREKVETQPALVAAAAPPMATEATAPHPPSASSPASTTAYPLWVLFEHCGEAMAAGSQTSADATTLATARSSGGHLVGVSLRLVAPPAPSSICVYFPDSADRAGSTVIAAHGDSVLIYIWFREGYHKNTDDYFVYNAGAAAAQPPRPPSLFLLPPYYLTKEEMEKMHDCSRVPVQRRLQTEVTGLLRRGEDEIIVAELKIATAGNATARHMEAELLLLRSGLWSIVRPAPVIHGHSQSLLSSWTTHTVLPVGDRQLCWVDVRHGILFCSVFDESPVLQHVPLPKEAEEMEPLFGQGSSRNVCISSDGSTVKFVGVFPRCCCGRTGSTHCQRSHHAYTVNTWTLRMDSMVWVMDGMVDATELWALNAYEGLPRVPLACPIASLADPHTICFLACECFYVRNGGDTTGWLILVDIRKKAIKSVSRHSDGQFLTGMEQLLPSRVSCYLDSNPSSSNHASSSEEGHIEQIPLSPMVVVDDGSSALCSWKSSPKSSTMQLSKVLAAFEEIQSYGFDPDDMLKAYNILSQHNGRRFRSLLGLPNNLRTDWLLMEVKATEN